SPIYPFTFGLAVTQAHPLIRSRNSRRNVALLKEFRMTKRTEDSFQPACNHAMGPIPLKSRIDKRVTGAHRMTPSEGESDVISWRSMSAPTSHREKLEEIALSVPAPASISLDLRYVLRT